MQQTQPRRTLAEKFALSTERLGPLPLVNHFISRLGLSELLDHYVPTTDRRCAAPHATALGVLLRSIVVEREPIYRQVETVHGFAPAMYGLEEQDLGHLDDDRLGRALDRLYDADRGALLTVVVLAVGKCFGVKFEELHNNSTSIRLCGQYRVQPETVRGQRPARIVFGYSKNVAAKDYVAAARERAAAQQGWLQLRAHIIPRLQPSEEFHERRRWPPTRRPRQVTDVEACERLGLHVEVDLSIHVGSVQRDVAEPGADGVDVDPYAK